MFGKLLKEQRKARGLSQSKLAERAGLTEGGIAQLEQGRREPSWSTVQALCKALGVTCEAFAEVPAVETTPAAARPKKAAKATKSRKRSSP